jgi:threonine synthase
LRPALDTQLVCAGCGHEPAWDDPLPFACPRRGDGGEHFLVRRFLDGGRHRELLSAAFEDSQRQPFVRFRRLFHSWQIARARGMDDGEYVDRVRDLDRRVAEVDGHGFAETPLGPQDALAEALHRPRGSLLVKDETGDVSGSHKARHLMQLAIWLETMQALGLLPAHDSSPLAIASCGNAALAAAVVARAMDRRLLVFVPTDAEASVLARMRELGAEIQVCPREEGQSGDPCLHAFHAATRDGALPFGCQGPENGLILEGGLSLGYEIVAQLRAGSRRVRQVVVQVGGGALGSSLFQAFLESRALDLIPKPLPRLHTVQTEGAQPLRRAFEALRDRVGLEPGTPLPPASGPKLARELDYAVKHRGEFMWPWESVPRSYATGILDDETYDWLTLVEGMLRSGGRSIVANERTLREAHDLSRVTTGIEVCATGASGVAGLMSLQTAGAVDPSATALVIFTGALR